jgi:FtsP/CotA-like multicopper oxidase with cupredoxin domain
MSDGNKPALVRRPRVLGTRLRSRRQIFGLGAAALAAGLILPMKSGLFIPRHAASAQEPGTFVEPPVRRSQDGVLETTLRAQRTSGQIGGQAVTSTLYDGIFPGPTLRVRQGDRLRVNLVNELEKPTNLHFHGGHVSPSGNSDNIFVHVEPGETFTYQYDLPADHRSGLNWYHPHAHGSNEDQVFGGMAGALIVEGEIDAHPAIAGLQERLLFLQNPSIAPDGRTYNVDEAHNAGVTESHSARTINGRLRPTLTLRPGETQRWRIANASANTFFRLSLEGHQFHLIARDGNPMSRVQTLDELLLGPGQRREVLIQGGGPGSYLLRTLEFQWGFETDPEAVIGHVEVAGEPQEPGPLPDALFPSPDLRGRPVDQVRHFSLSIQQTNDPNEPLFLVDGRVFDADRVDVVTHLDAVEEWTILNPSRDYHPFHIHVNDIQTIAINGRPVDNYGYEDTVLVPPNGGTMTMRTRFEDFTGRYVWHCHILRHEERGMMQVVEVRPKDGSPLPDGHSH